MPKVFVALQQLFRTQTIQIQFELLLVHEYIGQQNTPKRLSVLELHRQVFNQEGFEYAIIHLFENPWVGEILLKLGD
jgi:hypothetical protein